MRTMYNFKSSTLRVCDMLKVEQLIRPLVVAKVALSDIGIETGPEIYSPVAATQA
jgi:hypothetical protein